MSDTESSTVVCSSYASLPILTEENFADWEMQIITYLTGAQDHICVITPVKQANNTYKDPAPTADEKKAANLEIANWQKSECIITGCLMATAGKLHQEAILKHRQSSEPVYQLYSKISTYHQQCDASQ